MYINRSLGKRVEYIADHFPVILVSGARQVGKTTLLSGLARMYADKYILLLYADRYYECAPRGSKGIPELWKNDLYYSIIDHDKSAV